MNILLDTSALIIWLGIGPKVTPEMSAAIHDESNRVYVSSLSIWECRIKSAIGKLRVEPDLLEVIRSKQFKDLDFTLAHADEIKNLPLLHHDPFDRGLIAQARVESMWLLTTDAQMSRYDVRVIQG